MENTATRIDPENRKDRKINPNQHRQPEILMATPTVQVESLASRGALSKTKKLTYSIAKASYRVSIEDTISF